MMSEYCINLSLEVDKLVQGYFALVANDLVVGERNEVTCLESDIRTSIKAVALSAHKKRITSTLKIPETYAEQLKGKQPSSYSFKNVPYFGQGDAVYLAAVSQSISSIKKNQPASSNNQYYVSNTLKMFVFNQSRQLTSSLLWNDIHVTLRNNQDGLAAIANVFQESLESKYLMLTLGADGVLLQEQIEHVHGDFRADVLPALNPNAQDVAGAGDSFLVLASLALAVGGSVNEAAYLASLGASVQVSRVGNVPITTDEIRAELYK
jgi:hypothetical protein